MIKPQYAVDRLLQLEGKKHTCDPNDRGGETYCGITRRNFPNLQLWVLLDQGQPDEVLVLHVYKFYTDWWVNCGAWSINEDKLAVEYFLASVNCGVVSATKMLQRSLNYLNRDGKDYDYITVDGIFGKETTSAMALLEKRRGLFLLRKMFNVMLGLHYVDIWNRDSTQRKWVGWADRLWAEG